jgi:serine phosphatase RsbU (regulator of sigma subunit)
MSVATEKVSKGNFSFRVDTNGLGYDEIGSLAHSFNMMADKIDELMQDTAAKVEFKNNKQAVDAIREGLFPGKAFTHSNFRLAGASISSPVYGGDWWQYTRIRDHVVFALGKVADRGLTAAIMTAAVHGAFTTFTAMTQLDPKAVPSMKDLTRFLNLAAYDAGKGKGRMAFVLGIMDTQSGQLQLVNAGHTPPLLHRVGFGGRPEKTSERFSILTKKLYTAFGQSPEVNFEAESVQLKQNDSLFLYTHGLTSVKNLKGEIMLSTQGARESFAKLADEYGLQAQKISEGLIENSKKVWGKAAEALPDDATVLVASIPEDAYFMSVENGKSKLLRNDALKKAV